MDYAIYPFILGVILITGYLTFRIVNHFSLGYYREKKHIDKLLEYGLLGSFGFLYVYLSSKIFLFLFKYPFDFIDDNIIYFIPLFMASSLLAGLTYQWLWGENKRERKRTLYEKYHMEDYRKGWVIVHLKDESNFYGRLVFTDVDYETERFVFSIDSVQKLNKRNEIIEEYETKRELIFNVQDVIFIEYIKKEE